MSNLFSQRLKRRVDHTLDVSLRMQPALVSLCHLHSFHSCRSSRLIALGVRLSGFRRWCRGGATLCMNGLQRLRVLRYDGCVVVLGLDGSLGSLRVSGGIRQRSSLLHISVVESRGLDVMLVQPTCSATM